MWWRNGDYHIDDNNNNKSDGTQKKEKHSIERLFEKFHKLSLFCCTFFAIFLLLLAFYSRCVVGVFCVCVSLLNVRLFSGLSKPKMMNYISYFIYYYIDGKDRVWHIIKFHTSFDVSTEWVILEIPNKFKQQSIILLYVTNFPSSLSIDFTGSFIRNRNSHIHIHLAPIGYLAPATPNTVTVKLFSLSRSFSYFRYLLSLSNAAWQKFTFILSC